MSTIYVIHENDAWVKPLRRSFHERNLPYEEWFLATGVVDLDAEPPVGVFYNRISASSYTRGHRFAPEQTGIVLAWLERHGRRVVNDSRALRLEINKAAQYGALNDHGIATPRTIAAVGRDAIVEAARAFGPGPVMLKPNRGGKGHAVRVFDSATVLEVFVAGREFEPPVDGVSLLQQFVSSPDGAIVRVEFIGGRFYYAVRVETAGEFALCPADQCDSRGDGYVTPGKERPRFTITDDVDAELIARYEGFLSANGIEIGAIEFVKDINGKLYTYDVNTNTNYNPDAEAGTTRSGMDEIARFLGEELARVSAPRVRV